jgi:peroxiredoxin
MKNRRRIDLLHRDIRALSMVVLVALSAVAEAVTVGAYAPEFTLKRLDGGDLRLEEYRGRVVLINFWASWCGPCRQELPLLDRLHQQYQDAGFAVLGVNVEGTEAPARSLIDKVPVGFPVLIDANQLVSARYALEAVPSTVLIDRDGVVRYVHHGFQPGDEAEYLEVVKELIRE